MDKPSWHGHYLTRNEGERRPTRFVFVDVETNQEKVSNSTTYIKHSLRLGVACYVEWRRGRGIKEQWFDFEDATLFWQWLAQWQSKKQILWVVAHNAQFDLTILGLWQHLESGYYATTRPGGHYRDTRTGNDRVSGDWHGLLAIEGSPFHIETQGPRGRTNFTDLQNYYPCSLRDIGKTVGIVKGDWASARDDPVKLLAYCRNDVEILKLAYLGLVQRWEKERNGNWQFSAAGLAYSHYRHRYLKHDIAIHKHGNALDMERESLYGGEVRCWYRGRVNRPLVHVDVNSLYPSVMVDGVYPTALIDVVLRPNRHMFRSYTDRYACAARVTLATGQDCYPVRYSGKICYPIGKFTTTLAGPELMQALDNGHIVGCEQLALYTHAPLFHDYVLRWWNEKSIARRNNDHAAGAFAKLMLNSLPAKFAQLTPQWEVDTTVDVCAPWKTFPHKDRDSGAIYPARSVGWVGQVCRHRAETEHSFPLIYSYVTAYARVKMRSIRMALSPLNVYYQDTDSLIITRELYESDEFPHDLIGDGIGQLRVVGEYNSAEFRGPKNYTVDGRHVIAGIRRSDSEVARMRWSGTRFERSSHLFGRGPDGTLREHTVDIDTPGTDSEGGVRPDGFTRPLVLPSGLPDDVLKRVCDGDDIRKDG